MLTDTFTGNDGDCFPFRIADIHRSAFSRQCDSCTGDEPTDVFVGFQQAVHAGLSN
ncbi:hypothetical protein ACAX60_002147 [Serratia marcescens]|uniref:hypothetical protein n=1 Tax=Serratia marcescens TaxID=615 RepID=UPI0027E414F7|nr:hypothetical protein [Serratia marcescens]